jgi:hypothetical protein
MEYRLIKFLQRLNVKPPPHPAIESHTTVDTFINSSDDFYSKKEKEEEKNE